MNDREFDSIRPSAVQIAPLPLHDVVAGRLAVTVGASASDVAVFGWIRMYHSALLPRVTRCARATVPPVTVNALLRIFRNPTFGLSENRMWAVNRALPWLSGS